MAIGRLLDAGSGLPRTGYGVRHDRIQNLVSTVSVVVGLIIYKPEVRSQNPEQMLCHSRHFTTSSKGTLSDFGLLMGD